VTRPLILVTNDDGIEAEGLAALCEAVEPLGELWIVAPQAQQSAMSHALTLHKPLRVRELGPRRFAVTGTPTDCVFFAVFHLLPRRPDLVVSGVNHGPNIGDDVSYSGTVSAALEAAIMGIKGIAFSHLAYKHTPDFRDVAVYARELTAEVLERDLPPRVYLNVNAPNVAPGEVKGVRVTKLGMRHYDDCIVESKDPRGKPYYWVGGSGFRFEDIPGSDCNAVDEGYISITPLLADPTHAPTIDLLKSWNLER
jgi:5'-nucleotidase